LGYEGIDPSVLSRVLNGKRLLSLNQLDVLADILGLYSAEKELLIERLSYEICERYGLLNFLEHEKLKIFMQSVEVEIDNARKVRNAGIPGLALEWSDFIYERIHQEAGSVRLQQDRWNYLRLLSEIIIERLRVILEICPKEKVFLPTSRLCKELKSIGKELQDSRIIGISYSMLTNMFHVLSRHQDVLATYSKNLRFIEDERYDQIISLRAAALSYAYSKDKLRFKEIRDKLLKLKKTCDLSLQLQLFILEGIIRGEGVLGNSLEAHRMSETASDVCYKMEKSRDDLWIHRKIQLISAEAEIANMLNGGDKTFIEKRGKEGIYLAQQFGYIKYIDRIKNHLNAFL